MLAGHALAGDIIAGAARIVDGDTLAISEDEAKAAGWRPAKR